MTSTATVTQLRRVDADFRVHCKHEHIGKAVVGLNIPNDEDASQAAVRIVREATKD
jgi:hypothetical protein